MKPSDESFCFLLRLTEVRRFRESSVGGISSKAKGDKSERDNREKNKQSTNTNWLTNNHHCFS